MTTAVSTRQETTISVFIPVLHGMFIAISISEGVLIGFLFTQGLDEADICPTLKGFSFTNWDPEEEDLLGIGGSQSPAKRKLDDYSAAPGMLPPASDDHAFDMDAVPDCGGGDDSENETHLGMEDIDEEEAGLDRHRMSGHDPQPILARSGKELGIVELKDQLSSMPLEYSYFGATARSAWAGPLHWHFKRGPKRNLDFRRILLKFYATCRNCFFIYSWGSRSQRRCQQKEAAERRSCPRFRKDSRFRQRFRSGQRHLETDPHDTPPMAPGKDNASGRSAFRRQGIYSVRHSLSWMLFRPVFLILTLKTFVLGRLRDRCYQCEWVAGRIAFRPRILRTFSLLTITPIVVMRKTFVPSWTEVGITALVSPRPTRITMSLRTRAE